MFGFVLTAAVTVMHIYLTARACSIPWLRRYLPLPLIIGIGLASWLFFFLGRTYGWGPSGRFSIYLEIFGMDLMAVVFLLTVSLLAVDLGTGFGLFLKQWAPSLRGIALAFGALLGLFALIQGNRAPAVEAYEVYVPGLDDELEGTVVVGLSDLHLESEVSAEWLGKRLRQVQEQEPDLVVLLGDIFEGRRAPAELLLEQFRGLDPPLGIWAVTGNHDSFLRREGSESLLEGAGISYLRNSWREVIPGLVLAGIDDSRHRSHEPGAKDPIVRSLEGRPPGSAIFLSHRPLQAERLAGEDVDLMLSGHTHGGQIWPFDYLVRLEYPLLEGQYEVGGMNVIVCRGTGTWGPRMRLWQRGEIMRVTLTGKEKHQTSSFSLSPLPIAIPTPS